MKSILVVGGAGYIGSHTSIALQRAGFRPVVLDNFSQGHGSLLEPFGIEVVNGDICDSHALSVCFEAHEIDAVLHFAAHAYVGESVEQPAKYYRNNVSGTIGLLDAMLTAGVRRLVFSSSCATYGIPDRLPLDESALQRPISPYGRSKLMVEQILKDFDVAYGMKSIALRYFNAAGADPEGRLGEDHEPETHLIPRALLSVLGLCGPIPVFGIDHATSDGSGVRDYVHVCDLAAAHVLALDRLLANGDSAEYNLGSGLGYSVLQVLESVRRVTGRTVPTVVMARRPGDPAALFANFAKAAIELKWMPRYTDLDTIVRHAWQWHLKRHGWQRDESIQEGISAPMTGRG